MTGSFLALLLLTQAPTPKAAPFVISVVDAETRRGVPLVELETLHRVRFVTDSAGLVAFDEPGLMNQDVYFTVRAFGYDLLLDGADLRGRAFRTRPGRVETIPLRRVNLAERIYRVTGEGVYRDTILAGRQPPTRSPLLNGGVVGQDSVLSAEYRGKISWFWGDTLRAGNPIPNYHAPGATSLLPSRGGLDPDVGIDLQYEPDASGFARPTAKLSGDDPTWLTGLTVLHDASGRERMFATYDKVRNGTQTYRRGLVEWDDARREFSPIADVPLDAPIYPQGHSFLHTVNGTEYVYFAAPLPFARVRATPEAFRDLAQYEGFTPLPKGAKGDARTVERDAARRVIYSWKAGTPPARSDVLDNLWRYRAINTEDSAIGLQEVLKPRPIKPQGGSVNWNVYRGRFVAIFVENGGTSPLGEVYFAEADTPVGPWAFARKVATHADETRVYSFYNPKHHPFLDKDGGRTIFFEGTYATAYSGNPDPTPRYDYNQVMYKLNLGRPELSLPVPIYATTDAGEAGPVGTGGVKHPERHGRHVLYYAPDRPGISGTVPVYGVSNAAGGQDLRFGGAGGELLFYAYAGDARKTPMTTVPLLEFAHEDGVRHAYSVDHDWVAPGFRRTGLIVGHVWRSPMNVVLPRE